MKVFALLALAPLTAFAVCTTTNGATICSDPIEVFCFAPNGWDPVRHVCQPPQITEGPVLFSACQITVTYSNGDPMNPDLVVTPGCSDLGVEYALDAAKQKLRWAKQR